MGAVAGIESLPATPCPEFASESLKDTEFSEVCVGNFIRKTMGGLRSTGLRRTHSVA